MYISDATSILNVFFTGTINLILIALTVVSVGLVIWTRQRDRRLAREDTAEWDKAAESGGMG